MALCVLLAVSCGSEERENSQGSIPASGPEANPESEGPQPSRPRILVLGNSITAGFGLSQEQAFPARLQARVDSAGFEYEVVNAGLSGETTAGGRRRMEWLLRQDADILIIELGGNDGLRGTEPESMRDNLVAIIETARASNPDMKIVLGGMRMPINMGGPYRERFESVYPEIAEETGVVLIPHILEGVGGVPSMNQPDGIHPTAAGQEVIAETVWEALEPLLAESA
jgi:acyl-CoA thioesterase-1